MMQTSGFQIHCMLHPMSSLLRGFFFFFFSLNQTNIDQLIKSWDDPFVYNGDIFQHTDPLLDMCSIWFQDQYLWCSK
jgi:hypothetical protein